jgi:hypothetical protein
MLTYNAKIATNSMMTRVCKVLVEWSKQSTKAENPTKSMVYRNCKKFLVLLETMRKS